MAATVWAFNRSCFLIKVCNSTSFRASFVVAMVDTTKDSPAGVLPCFPALASASVQSPSASFTLLGEEPKILAAEGANPSTYATQFTSAREILSPLALNSQWVTHHQKINSEIVTTLALCADRLREDSSSLPAEEFAEALATLDQLEEQVQQGDFDEALKIFVTAEIEILRAGIRDYPTLGLAAIVDTLEKAVGKMMLARASGQIEMRAKPVSKILQMLSTFARWIIVHEPQMKMLSEAVKKLLDDGS